MIIIILVVAFINQLVSYLSKSYHFNHLYCGLVGFSGSKGINSDKIKLLLLYNEARGKDSAGFYLYEKGKPIEDRIFKAMGEVSKNVLPAWDFGAKATVFIGHTRQATSGSKVVTNTHPFLFNSKTGKFPIVGAHNGRLSNEYPLRTKYGFKADEIPVDSMLIFRALHETGDTTILSQIDKLETAVLYTKDDNTLFAFRLLDRPLYRGKLYLHDEKSKENYLGMYISSLKESLEAIGCMENSIEEFKENTLYEITDGEIKKTTVIKRDPVSYGVMNTRDSESSAYGRTYGSTGNGCSVGYGRTASDDDEDVRFTFDKSQYFGDDTETDNLVKKILNTSKLAEMNLNDNKELAEDDAEFISELCTFLIKVKGTVDSTIKSLSTARTEVAVSLAVENAVNELSVVSHDIEIKVKEAYTGDVAEDVATAAEKEMILNARN